MTTDARNRLEALLNQSVDGTLRDDEERQLAELLRTDAAARRQYRQFMALHADLHWDYASATVSQPEANNRTGRERSARKRNVHSYGVAAAVLLLTIAGGVLLTWRLRGGADGDRPVIGRLTRLAGEVQVVDRGKTQAVKQDVDLRAEASIHVVGLTGLAALRLDDGTEISIAGETHIECRREAGRTRITLHEGYLSANVTAQAAARPLLIQTSSAEMQVLGTRLAVGADQETSELGVQQGRVRLKRLTDGETVEVQSGQYAVVSQRSALETRPWPTTPETWREDFENGLPDGWRYGQWFREGDAENSRGGVRAARRFALDGSDSTLHRITLPKQWMQGLWRLETDSRLHFTFKMSRPGWFQIMMGVRSDVLHPSHIGNYELQSSFWKKGEPNEWQTVSVPFSAFRKNIPGVGYADLPPDSPRAGDVAYLLWFSTGDADRGLVIDRIWIDRSSHPSEDLP